jgi:amidohydrolase
LILETNTMPNVCDIIDKHRPDIEPLQRLYKHFHQNPELSNQEKETSASIFNELSDLKSFHVKSNIGGYGIAAVLSNGSGPTVLLRADFDALPVREDTGLVYASTKVMKNADGKEVSVAHACGHDMHTTALIGAAHLLNSAQDSWSGTLVLVFQPAEEAGTGAHAMVNDGLYEKHGIPIPDVVLAGHVLPMRAGSIGTRTGLIANSADSMHVTIYGRGAHASMPDRSVDPIVMAAGLITKLQTIVSREMDPHDTSVVTVASIHSGDSDNVISDVAVLALDVRNASAKSREHVIASIKRIVHHESAAGRAVKEPKIEFTRQYPVTKNDADATAKLSETFAAQFGQAFDPNGPPCGASEDFSNLATAVDRPYCFWTYGGTDPELYDKAEQNGSLQEDIPANHSGKFAPVIMPTLQIGLDAYAAAALAWLVK